MTFLFDECIGKPVMAELEQLLLASGVQVVFRHILEFQQQGVPDAEWIPALESENVVLVTADRGRGGRGLGKLPRLCREFRITHVLLSASLHRKPSAEKIRAIHAAWESLEATVSAPRGSGFVLRLSQRGHPLLEKKYEPPSE